ncbi:MAG: hypothetical protein GVY17_00115 [Cyanobacteria bacterium]|jgi:hypothetical protein|nr:hypothetical protein [Cyanobacteria bacterium GSL.Bin21]
MSCFGGIAASFAIYNASSILLYPLFLVTWAFTVGGARKLQTCIFHRCVHQQFFGDLRDRWLAEAVSTVLLIQNFDAYHFDHVKLHHRRDRFATFEHDPDAQFLWALGFQPKLSEVSEGVEYE